MWLILFPIFWSTIYCGHINSNYSEEDLGDHRRLSYYIENDFKHFLVDTDGWVFMYTGKFFAKC